MFFHETKETFLFPRCQKNVTDLRSLEYRCYVSSNLDAKVKIILSWMKEPNQYCSLSNNDEFDDFWDNSVVSEDGYIELKMGLMHADNFGVTPNKKKEPNSQGIED